MPSRLNIFFDCGAKVTPADVVLFYFTVVVFSWFAKIEIAVWWSFIEIECRLNRFSERMSKHGCLEVYECVEAEASCDVEREWSQLPVAYDIYRVKLLVSYISSVYISTLLRENRVLHWCIGVSKLSIGCVCEREGIRIDRRFFYFSQVMRKQKQTKNKLRSVLCVCVYRHVRRFSAGHPTRDTPRL